MLHTLSVFNRSDAYVSTRNPWLTVVLVKLAFISFPG